MPAYRFKPVPVPDNSVWQGKYFHLTYKSFITITMFLAMVASTTSMPIVAWSYAHELGAGGVGDDEDEDEYEHSHFAIIFLNKIKIIGSRKFDIIKVSDDGTDATSYHPHILPKLTIGQMETIFLHYHVGRKYSPEEGKVVYKKPVRTENYIAPFFEFLRANINEVIEAPSLLEACVAGEVRPRSVLDIQALRNEAQMTAAATFKHLFSRDSFLKIGPDSYGALHIWGGSGLGKTKWACAQFHNPLLIKPFNKVGSLEAIGKKFNAEIHDGIVLDEADLTFMTREQVIAFLDVDEPCDLGVRLDDLVDVCPEELKERGYVVLGRLKALNPACHQHLCCKVGTLVTCNEAQQKNDAMLAPACAFMLGALFPPTLPVEIGGTKVYSLATHSL